MNCAHKDFRVNASVNRFEDTGEFSADILINCGECGLRFRFLGLPAGLSFKAPMVSIDGLELRAPIEPEDVPRLVTHMTFQAPPKPTSID